GPTRGWNFTRYRKFLIGSVSRVPRRLMLVGMVHSSFQAPVIWVRLITTNSAGYWSATPTSTRTSPFWMVAAVLLLESHRIQNASCGALPFRPPVCQNVVRNERRTLVIWDHNSWS